MAFTRDLVWMLIELKQPRRALDEVNRLLESAFTVKEYRPLLIDRARLLIAQEKWAEAEKDVEAYFAQVDRKEADYADWADACLVRGLLRERRGDAKGAQEAWRLGLLREHPVGLPPLPRGRLIAGPALETRFNGITFFSQLAALTDELTENDAAFLFNNLIVGTGTVEQLFRTVGRKAFPPDFMRQTVGVGYRSAHGRDLTRRMAFRQIPFSDFYVQPMRLLFYHGIQTGALTGAVPGERAADSEAILWRDCQRLIDTYNEDKFDEKLFEDILQVWRGKVDPADAWARAAGTFDRQLRIGTAYVLGRRMLELQQPEYAIPFFEEVLRTTEKEFEVHRRSASEALKKAKAMRGK